ncbi:MAG: PilZ domain-containing protein [Brevinematales bacterium]
MEKEIAQRNEIVSLFNKLRLNRVKVKLENEEKKFSLEAFITKADPSLLGLFYDDVPEIIPIKNVKISFDLNNNFYNSENVMVRLVNVPLKSIEVNLPEKLFFHSVRKYPRIEGLDEIKVFIKNIETTEVSKQTSVNLAELPATLRGIYLEVQNEKPDIKKIIKMIGEELSRFSNRFKINLFKDLSKLTPIENVVNIYKKTFWIGDTENLSNYVHLGEKYGVVGYEKYFDLIGKKVNPQVLEQIRQTYISKGIISYAMVPIIIGDRVFGVIEVSVPNDPKYKQLSIYEIFYIKGLADIVGEVIVKTQSTSENADVMFNVIDLSMGGILANTKNVYITHYIKENSVVVLSINYKEKTINIKSRVVRYHYVSGDNAGLNVAFEFYIDDEETKAELSALIKTLSKKEKEA